MRLRLTCHFDDQPEPVDAVVSVGANTPISELADALALKHGSSADVSLLVVRRLGGLLDPHTPVHSSGIRDGDELFIGAVPPPTLRTPIAEPHVRGWRVHVQSGPDAGKTWLLQPGRYRIGRAMQADVRLMDDSVSGTHAQLDVTTDGVVIADTASSNGTTVDGHRLEDAQAITDHAVVQVGANVLSIQGHEPQPRAPQADQGRVEFNRPMRRPILVADGDVRLPEVPRKRDPHPIQWIMIAAPAAMGLLLFLFMSNPLFLLMMIGTPIMFAGQQWSERRRLKREGRDNHSSFADRLATADAELQSQNRVAAEALRLKYPPAAEWLARARNSATDLWERRPTDPDFMTLRLGLGRQSAPVSVAGLATEMTTDLEPKALAQAETVARRHETVLHVPITANLTEVGVLGVAGSQVESVIAGLVIQAACAHSPRDLAIVFVGDDESSRDWAWLKWLPHTHSLTGDDRAATVTSSGRDAAATFDIVDQLLTQRERHSQTSMAAGATWNPHVLVIVSPGAPISPATFDRVMSNGHRLGASSIVWANETHLLPGACRTTLTVADQHSGSVDAHVAQVDGTGRPVNLDRADPIDCQLAARTLAGWIDVSADSGAREVPCIVLLAEELGFTEFAPEEVISRWAQAGLERDAPIGRTAAGSLSLDMRVEGPHGLVAGTTGSGKSEFLQAYITSLAATYSPQKINFVLVDYKGGAAFRECVDLPHTVGFVTDLDENLAQRALTSLDAELVRRERILNEHQMKDLLALERSQPHAAPPVLLIVIDEFAALVKECEAFVDGVMDIAQRGRSLGVHLILATQKPGGVVNTNIQANTEIRVALRMASEDESRDVIDAPDAAHLPKANPGRAYVRHGAGAPQVFQSAYANNPHRAPAAADESDPEDAVEWVLPFPAGMATPTIPKSAESRSEVSDLDMIVAQVRKAHEATAGPDPHRPWLEPLPSSLRLHDLQSAPDATGSRKRTVGNPVGVIGLADLPKAQAQPPYRLDVAELGNVAIYGTNRTGKSTLLRSLTYDLASRYSPDEVNIYGIDHASRGLGALTALPHVGAVLRDDQREETDRFINMLRTWVDKRKAQLGAGTASSFRQLRETAENAPPFIFVMIDGYANFHATYENVDYGRFNEQFARLVADGPSVGVHFILTATNHRGIPSTVATHCAGRLVFRQANPDDYYHHGLEKLIGGKPGPGRCWDHDGVELQVATITDLPDGRADAEAIQLLAGRTKRLDTVSAATVKTRPDRVTADMLETHPSRPQRMVPLGLDTGTLHTVYLDLDQKNTLMVAGPARSGTTSMIVHAATQILTSASRKSLLTSASIAQQMTETFADRINVVDWYGDVDSENLVEALDSDTIVALDASPLIQQQHFDGEAATGLTPEALGSIRASAGAVLIEVDTDVLTGPSGYAPWLDGCLFRDSAVVALTSQALVVDRLRFEPAVSDTSLRPGQGIYSSEQSPAIVQFAVTGNANQRGT